MKPKIIVSKCLGFANCRYNGQTIPNKYVDKLKSFFDFEAVCPEVEIGLGVPRKPIRMVIINGEKRLIQPATEKDITKNMVDFVNEFLENKEPNGFLLKHGSPSCGLNNVNIYDEQNLNKKPSRGPGFFGEEIKKKFIVAIEDEGHLNDFTYRENFYTKVYAHFNFKSISSIHELIDFHANNKYLILAYDEVKLRELGRLVANQKEKQFHELLKSYEELFLQALSNNPGFGNWINVIMHMYGGFSKNLQIEERELFHEIIEEYRDERIPLSVLTKLVLMYAKRFKIDYLLNQTALNRFPKELIEISDSGKGR